MIAFLTDRGVPIDRTEMEVRKDADGPYATILTAEHRALLPMLDPSVYPVEEIREWIEGDHLADDEILGAVTDTLELLRTTIGSLADDEAFVILIY